MVLLFLSLWRLPKNILGENEAYLWLELQRQRFLILLQVLLEILLKFLPLVKFFVDFVSWLKVDFVEVFVKEVALPPGVLALTAEDVDAVSDERSGVAFELGELVASEGGNLEEA